MAFRIEFQNSLIVLNIGLYYANTGNVFLKEGVCPSVWS